MPSSGAEPELMCPKTIQLLNTMLLVQHLHLILSLALQGDCCPGSGQKQKISSLNYESFQSERFYLPIYKGRKKFWKNKHEGCGIPGVHL